MTILTSISAQFDVRSLPSVSLQEKNYLPCCSGIYFVISSANKILYIGQSENIRERWKAHRCAKQIAPTDRIAWWQVPKESLRNAEVLLIEQFKPKLNVRAITVTLPEINKTSYSVPELMNRYGLSSRQAIYDRINHLKIDTRYDGKRGKIRPSDVQRLDELHFQLIERSDFKTSSQIFTIKRSLRLLRDYYEGKAAMSISEVIATIQEALSHAEQLN